MTTRTGWLVIFTGLLAGVLFGWLHQQVPSDPEGLLKAEIQSVNSHGGFHRD